MPLGTPFRLGPFMVDENGGLMPPAGGGASFTLRWRGCLVSASMRPIGAPEQPDAVELSLQAVLGRVPSSADVSAQQREVVLEALCDAADHVTAPLCFALSVDHRAIMHGSEALPVPVTSRALVTQVTRFLLNVAPYLDFADEVGARPAGRVNT